MVTHLEGKIVSELDKLDFVEVELIDRTPTMFRRMPEIVQIKINYKSEGQTLENVRDALNQNPEIGEPESAGEGYLTYHFAYFLTVEAVQIIDRPT